MLKKYEPRFELEEAFTPGVRGRADPRFSVTRAERLRLLAVRKRDNLGIVSVHESFEDIFDHVREDGAEADPRINWRVTARHGDYYIYIMALDQGLSRFACCLQKTSEFEERSYGRCLSTRYEAGNLAEIEHVLDDIYARLKHEDEQRRQQDEQRRQQDRIDKEVQKAVEKEREIWRDHLARSRAKRLQVIGLCVLALPVLAALVFPRFGWPSGRFSARADFATGLFILPAPPPGRCCRTLDETSQHPCRNRKMSAPAAATRPARLLVQT